MPRKRLIVPVWLAWLLLTGCVAAKYFRWEVEYFRSPGTIFYTLVLCALPLFVLACAGYLRLRRHSLWRFEVPALAAFAGVCLLLYQPLAALVATLFFVACFATGSRVARPLGITLETPAELLTLGFGLGCALLIPVLFVLGLFRLYYPWVFLLLLIVPCLLLWREAWRGLAVVREVLASSDGLRHPLAGIAVVFAALATVLALASLLAPSIAYDPLAMHLASARSYAAQHALEILPSLDYTYYPQGCEVLMALAWSLGGQAAAQMISPLFWVLSLVLLLMVARACGLGKAAAFAGVIAAAMMPFAHWSGANAKNDSAMVFFQAAALYAFIRWLATRNPAWIPAGALFLGSSFAVKHVALFGAVPLVCFFLYACRRRLRTALAFCLILAASALYWHVRTLVLTGSPVFPAKLRQSVAQAGRPSSRGLLARSLLVPWRAQFGGSRAFESPLPNPMGVVLLVFLPLAFLIPGAKTPARRACLLFCAIYLAYWMVTISMVRYAILPISLLVVLLAGKAKTFYDELDHRALRASIAGAFGGVLLFSTLGIAIIEVNAPMLLLFAGRVRSDQYLDLALQTHRSLSWLDAAHIQTRIFGFDTCSRAYAPDPAKFYCIFNHWEWVGEDIARCRCEYAVLPQNRKPDGAAQPLYRDDFFTVWRLSQAGQGGDH